MPTLDWIGKKAGLNHDRKVPFHLLKCDRKLSVGVPGSGNLLVEGDNPLALKALLLYYAGQVKRIYIDPPYNTGNENWVYNDAVNSLEMRTWLGQIMAEQAIRFCVLDRRVTQGARGPARRRRCERVWTFAATCAQPTSPWTDCLPRPFTHISMICPTRIACPYPKTLNGYVRRKHE